jgi:hypothetical protein
MKSVSHSLFRCCMCVLILFVFIACGTPEPESQLTAHMDNIVSLVMENRTDAGQAAIALKQYVDDNINDIERLLDTLETQNSSQDDETKLNVDMIFRHTQIMDRIIQLEQEEPALMNDARIEQALKPLFDIFKDNEENEQEEGGKTNG